MRQRTTLCTLALLLVAGSAHAFSPRIGFGVSGGYCHSLLTGLNDRIGEKDGVPDHAPLGPGVAAHVDVRLITDRFLFELDAGYVRVASGRDEEEVDGLYRDRSYVLQEIPVSVLALFTLPLGNEKIWTYAGVGGGASYIRAEASSRTASSLEALRRNPLETSEPYSHVSLNALAMVGGEYFFLQSTSVGLQLRFRYTDLFVATIDDGTKNALFAGPVVLLAVHQYL